MAKFAVVFLFALIFVQYAVAGVIRRDAPQPPTPTEKDFEKALEQMQEFIRSAFTPENLNKLNQEFQQLGETLTIKGKQFVEDASNNFNKQTAA